MKKIFLTILFLVLPFSVIGAPLLTDSVFKAQVIEIIEQRNNVGENKETNGVQQNIKLLGLEGERYNLEYEYLGITEFQLIKSNIYKVGEKVLLLESLDAENNKNYYIIDYIRTSVLYYLFLLFVFVLLLVGRVKAFRSLISLFLTFVIIIKYIIPEILLGGNPLVVTFIGSILIIFVIIYITEGFSILSHVAVISIVFSLLISIFLSWFFVSAGKLSGLFSEEIASLATIGSVTINFQGLLLAGIIIGLLGVLDDIVIAQISTVEQIYLTDKSQKRKEIYSKAFKVGVSHISSMTNTLFLAYAGASLPLLVLLVSGQSVFTNIFDAINNEEIATEIVRTLTGSIGLVLSVPISTLLAVLWFKKKR